MFTLSWNLEKNDTPNERGGEGYYSSEKQADVIAVMTASVTTVDIAQYSFKIAQIAAPTSAEQAAFMRAIATVLSPAE